MANEITVNASLSFSKDGSRASFSPGAVSVTMTGSQYCGKTQTVGTSEENLDKGDISTIGLVMVRNLDNTNYVELGSSTGVYSVKLLPDELNVFRWDGTNIIAKANTANCIVEYLMLEN